MKTEFVALCSAKVTEQQVEASARFMKEEVLRPQVCMYYVAAVDVDNGLYRLSTPYVALID